MDNCDWRTLEVGSGVNEGSTSGGEAEEGWSFIEVLGREGMAVAAESWGVPVQYPLAPTKENEIDRPKPR